jgi:hypothetical protein
VGRWESQDDSILVMVSLTKSPDLNPEEEEWTSFLADSHFGMILANSYDAEGLNEMDHIPEASGHHRKY